MVILADVSLSTLLSIHDINLVTSSTDSHQPCHPKVSHVSVTILDSFAKRWSPQAKPLQQLPQSYSPCTLSLTVQSYWNRCSYILIIVSITVYWMTEQLYLRDKYILYCQLYLLLSATTTTTTITTAILATIERNLN